MNAPFDRNLLRLRERPLSSDLDRAQSQIDRTLREVLDQLFLGRAADFTQTGSDVHTGFIGDGFQVLPNSPVSMSVVLRPGLGFFFDATTASSIDGVAGVDDLSRYKPLMLLAQQTLSPVPAADAVNPRIDIVEVRYNRLATDPATRDILDPGTGVFTPTLVNKTLAWVLDGLTSVNGTQPINYKSGTPAAVPVAATTSAGYIKIAEVRVNAAPPTTFIDTVNLTDLRPLLFPSNVARVSLRYLVSGAAAGVATVRHVAAPPGVRVALWHSPTAVGGVFPDVRAYVVAGKLTSGSVGEVIHTWSSFSAAVSSVPKMVTGGTTTPGGIVAVDATIQTRLQQVLEMSPTIGVGLGQPIIEIPLRLKTWSGAGGDWVNETDFVELCGDVSWRVR